MLVPAAVAVIALIPPGLVKPGSGVIWEGESSYQFIQVQEIAHHGRVLHLNEGWADHSVWYPNRVLTGGYWDQFLLAPTLHGPGFRSLAMIGYAGGTVGREYGTFWPSVNVLGIELDPKVTEIGRRYFGLASNPRVRVATADGRPYLTTHSARYDGIFLDAFRQPYIPFYLTTQEFWRLAQDRLNPGGMVMANVGTVPGSERLPTALAGTMATVFPVRLPLAHRRLQRDRGRVLTARERRPAARPSGRGPARAAAGGAAGGEAQVPATVERSPDRRSRPRGMADRPADRALRQRRLSASRSRRRGSTTV